MTLSAALVTPAAAARWEADGFLIVRSLLTYEEAGLLSTVARADPELAAKAHPVKQIGHLGRHTVADPGDMYGAVARCGRVVNTVQQLLGRQPVAQYHHKMMLTQRKEVVVPVDGPSAWQWHQDCGYWGSDGPAKCPTPAMASCFIAIDKCTHENGCLQLLKGSHLAGRLEHTSWGGEVNGRTGALPEHLLRAMMNLASGGGCELVDALMFHCNTLHHSEECRTTPRWSIICCYNAVGNQPAGAAVELSAVAAPEGELLQSGYAHLARLLGPPKQELPAAGAAAAVATSRL